MSMYNAIFGYCPIFDVLLYYLQLKKRTFGRFRDCYLQRRNGDLVVAVYARIGGNNRDDYKQCIDDIKSHPLYIDDEDDSFDSTYASFYFKVDDKLKTMLKQLLDDASNDEDREKRKKAIIYDTPEARWQAFLGDLGSGKSTSQTEKAMKIAKSLGDAISDNPNGGLFTINPDGTIDTQ